MKLRKGQWASARMVAVKMEWACYRELRVVSLIARGKDWIGHGECRETCGQLIGSHVGRG